MNTHKRSILIMGLIAVFSLLGVSSSSFAVDNEMSRESLRGLNGVYVFINQKASGESEGLSENQILADVTSKLESGGIKVLTEEEWLKEKGGPFIHFIINILKKKKDVYPYHISLLFKQLVSLERNAQIKTFGATWSIEVLGKDETKGIQATIKDTVDTFINAYFSVNPKKQEN